MEVNEARKVLFAQGTQSIEHIPPSQAALIEHIKHAAYQAGYVWGQTFATMQELPNPTEWGWTKVTDGWTPHWTILPEA